jgi:hypothetical protein
MWRTIAVLIVLGLILVAAQKYRTQHPGGALAGRAVYEGFWEMRLTIQAGSRDFEFVAVGDKPLQEECDGGEARLGLAKFCTAANHCTKTAFTCEREVQPRYQRMLDQQPASLHYMHYAGDTPEGPRRAVIVGWGMTEPESQQICQKLVADPGMKMEGLKKATCI